MNIKINNNQGVITARFFDENIGLSLFAKKRPGDQEFIFEVEEPTGKIVLLTNAFDEHLGSLCQMLDEITHEEKLLDMLSNY